MKADHKAALRWATVISRAMYNDKDDSSLAAAYLELRELAKAALDHNADWAESRHALRAAIGEE